MSGDLVGYSVDGAVALVTLDRPPVNALSDDLVEAIDRALGEAADPQIRAVVVTGAPHFAAGADITEFKAAFDMGHEDSLAGNLGAVVRRLERLAKPTIAAVRGYALGGGLELAMGCDFRYLSDQARVGQPEVLLGIIPGAGGTQRLARIVGFQRALEMNMSGRQVPADEALAMGLADRVLPDDEVLPVALADARAWAEGPTLAYTAIKVAMREGYGHTLDEGLALESRQFNNVFGTKDAKEGVKAFLTKTRAEFNGE